MKSAYDCYILQNRSIDESFESSNEYNILEVASDSEEQDEIDQRTTRERQQYGYANNSDLERFSSKSGKL